MPEQFYKFDAIISVGYRVKSLIAIRFRIWATKRLTEYIVNEFIMDDERLKNPPVDDSNAPGYFDEMLERIQGIRAIGYHLTQMIMNIFVANRFRDAAMHRVDVGAAQVVVS
ncbi:MAG: RhuM family protein [Desulfoplanes sp.]